jgi:uncharacterized membrane protein
MYDVALFIHLLGFALLIGEVTTTLIATLRSQTVPTVQELRSVTAVTKKIDVVIGPAMLLILAGGLYMVARGGISWTSGWIDVALVIFLVMAVLGPTVEAGHAKRLLAAAAKEPDGPLPEDLDRLRREPTVVYVSLFGSSQIIAFLYLMTAKPGLVGSLVACAVAGAISAVVAAWRLRSLGMLPPVQLPGGPEADAAPDATPVS